MGRAVSKGPNISFRLPVELDTELRALAAERGCSPGELAARTVTRAIEARRVSASTVRESMISVSNAASRKVTPRLKGGKNG